jgi:hypothetical protein
MSRSYSILLSKHQVSPANHPRNLLQVILHKLSSIFQWEREETANIWIQITIGTGTDTRRRIQLYRCLPNGIGTWFLWKWHEKSVANDSLVPIPGMIGRRSSSQQNYCRIFGPIHSKISKGAIISLCVQVTHAGQEVRLALHSAPMVMLSNQVEFSFD